MTWEERRGCLGDPVRPCTLYFSSALTDGNDLELHRAVASHTLDVSIDPQCHPLSWGSKHCPHWSQREITARPSPPCPRLSPRQGGVPTAGRGLGSGLLGEPLPFLHKPAVSRAVLGDSRRECLRFLLLPDRLPRLRG